MTQVLSDEMTTCMRQPGAKPRAFWKSHLARSRLVSRMVSRFVGVFVQDFCVI